LLKEPKVLSVFSFAHDNPFISRASYFHGNLHVLMWCLLYLLLYYST
jgi:hypothetical protein